MIIESKEKGNKIYYNEIMYIASNYYIFKKIQELKYMLNKIEELNLKSKPLIEQLQSDGISEKAWDSYYNIYLNKFYQFSDDKIVYNDELPNKAMS